MQDALTVFKGIPELKKIAATNKLEQFE